ncbi:MAG: membrane protein insertase YidC, partial [Planctomycetota bacterium]
EETTSDTESTEEEATSDTETTDEEAEEPSEEEVVTPDPDDEDIPEVDEKKDIVLENKFIRASWTNRGAALQYLQLRDYRAPYMEEDDHDRPPLKLVRDFESGYYSDTVERVTFLPADGEGPDARKDINTADVVYEVEEETDDRIVFYGVVDARLGIRKTVRVPSDSYHYTVDLEFVNRTDEQLRFTYRLRSAAGIERESLDTRYLSTVVGVQEKDRYDVQQLSVSKLTGDPQINESTGIAWAGVLSQYFISLTKPEDPSWIRSVEQRLVEETDIAEAQGRWDADTYKGQLPDMSPSERRDKARSNGTSVLISTEQTVDADEVENVQYEFIGAPQLKDALAPYGKGLVDDLRKGAMNWFTWILSLGTVSFLMPLMIWILDFFHMIIPNYGVAIILLTICVRGALHPLTKSSQMGMHKMRLLQPKIKELQKKYGDERDKMVQEQMKLYSKYGVHPMSGCWPMLLQMPIFLSLFMSLRTYVPLRQAMFIPGWITDLSQPDTIWHFPFHLPVVGNQLNILPLIMVVAWMLNHHLTPKPSDSQAQQQQKIMKWMPVLFAVLFYQMSSGLVLYITASSGFAALQNWWIRSHIQDMELEPVEAENKTKKKKDRSRQTKKPEEKGLMGKLMDKLEQQEKQSRQIRNDD